MGGAASQRHPFPCLPQSGPGGVFHSFIACSGTFLGADLSKQLEQVSGNRIGLATPHPDVDGSPRRRVDVLQDVPIHQPIGTGTAVPGSAGASRPPRPGLRHHRAPGCPGTDTPSASACRHSPPGPQKSSFGHPPHRPIARAAPRSPPLSMGRSRPFTRRAPPHAAQPAPVPHDRTPAGPDAGCTLVVPTGPTRRSGPLLTSARQGELSRSA